MTAENDKKDGQNVGVINPYALAEVITGRKIAWKDVSDVPGLLEDILHTPYKELFDPKYNGPLYTGFKLKDSGELVQVRSPLLDVAPKKDANDLKSPLDLGYTDIKHLADLGPHFKASNVGKIEVEQTDVASQGYLSLKVRLPEEERLQRLAQVFTPDVVGTIAPDPTATGKSQNGNRTGGKTGNVIGSVPWSDPGRFFNEAAEFFDPIQGAVANCYYIAALSAVAWAMPYHIKHLTRATGQQQQRFTNLIRFYNPDSDGKLDKEIEVTDSVPYNASTGDFVYGRSSEQGEIWPAVYEKAYAKLITNHEGDTPDITSTGWGDMVWATAQLTGGGRYYYYTSSHTADELWNLVRENSRGGRTFNPMTAWTYSSGEGYADANIVASHAYTVLGWAYHRNRKYIVLRNPWGNTEATVQTLDTTIFMHDISWWRPINLTTIDGTFAIEASGFKKYFKGHGVVK